MRKMIFLGLITAAAIVVIAGFFQPWAEISTSVGKVTKGVTGVLDGTFGKISLGSKVLGGIMKIADVVDDTVGDVTIKKNVSGVEIPKLVNNKSSKMAFSITELMFKSTEGLGWKSYAVYIFPVLAVVCVILAFAGIKKMIAVIVMIVLSGAVSAVGLYNLHTTDLNTLIVQIKIGSGIWNTLYAFGSMAVIGIGWIILGRERREPAE